MYNDSMEQLCGDALPSLSSQLLESHHYRLRMTAQELFLCTCSAAGVKVLPHFVERLSKEIDELFENFVNQNQVK
ncbi:atlastin-3-like [Amblyomma americanum]